LSRAEILGVARQFIETDGLEALSFPRLAESMNAGTSSLRTYFQTKGELLATLVDDVTTEMYLRLPEIGDGYWDQEVVEHFVCFRGLLQRTPVYREVFTYRTQTLFEGSRMGPFVLRRLESNLALFVRGGLTSEEAVEAFNAFHTYTRAFVLIEHGTEEEGAQRVRQLSSLVLQEAPADLPMMAAADMVQIQALNDDLYRFGLRLLVAGLCVEHPVLEVTRASEPRKVPTGRAAK
jgi:AcrR family transcriptional regulator